MIEFHNRVIGNSDRIKPELLGNTNTVKINFMKKQKRITCIHVYFLIASI